MGEGAFTNNTEVFVPQSQWVREHLAPCLVLVTLTAVMVNSKSLHTNIILYNSLHVGDDNDNGSMVR